MNDLPPFSAPEINQTSPLDIGKAFFYLFLSIIKAILQSLVLLVWLIVGLVFAASNLPQFSTILNFVLNWQILILLPLIIYETILNFKKIKDSR